MSDFHILTQDGKKKSARVVFHIPIPASSNTAGITWRDAIVKEQGGANAIESVLPDITTQEESDMKAGVIFEQQETVRFSSVGLTNAQRLNEVKAAFTIAKAELVAEKQVTLDFIGYEGNE